MSLSQKKLDEINNKKIISFLSPLLLGLKDDEYYINDKCLSKNSTKFDFNKSFIMFTDVQAYRHISVIGILNTFDRTLKYRVLNLALLLDVWYNESTLMNKDDLRTCDLLIIHGTTDYRFGTNKATALIDLINTRKSYGKLTWIFIHGCEPAEFSKNQPGVLDEINNVFSIKLVNRESLVAVLSRAKQIELVKDMKIQSDNNDINIDTDDLHLI